VVLAIILSTISWVLARRFSGLGPEVLWQALRGPALATAIMAAGCVLADRLWLADLVPPQRLVALALLGGVTYGALVGGHLLIQRRRVPEPAE
jgi:hypothetical protein